MKQGPKSESGGRGRGRKEALADKPLDFENLRSLSVLTLSIKGLFHSERMVWYVTRILIFSGC